MLGLLGDGLAALNRFQSGLSISDQSLYGQDSGGASVFASTLHGSTGVLEFFGHGVLQTKIIILPFCYFVFAAKLSPNVPTNG